MIGQKKLIKRINMYTKETLPKLIILCGDNSEKVDIYQFIAKKFDLVLNYCEIKVDEVRRVIDNSYKVDDRILYVFQESEKMSLQAKNALLKITEEPPKNCYFILSIENESQIIETLKSRGQLLKMDNYSKQELMDYLESKDEFYLQDEKTAIVEISTNPNELDLLIQYNAKEFLDYVEKVVENLAVVNSANLLKVSQKIKLKPEDEGYELKIFINAIIRSFIDKSFKTDDSTYVINTLKLSVLGLAIIHQLQNSSYSKLALFDSFMLGAKEIWS